VLPALGVETIGRVWEPACGEGHMGKVIKDFATGLVIALIFSITGTARLRTIFSMMIRSCGLSGLSPTRHSRWRASSHCGRSIWRTKALLVRTQWIEGIGRYEKLFRDRPPTIYAPFVERVPMVKGRWDPDASTATSYAWFVWLNGASGSTRVLWTPPGCRRELARPDDVARFAAWSLAPSDAPLLEFVKPSA
jgi:hypothetical protein